jgi:hypothetical protein
MLSPAKQLQQLGVVMKYGDNFWKFKRQFKSLEGTKNRMMIGEVSNTARQARALNDREGYFVVSNPKLHMYVKAEMGRMKTQFGPGFSSPFMVSRALERGILKYIKWLRSTIGSKPPILNQTSPRSMHPGKWADITGRLNNSWRYRVAGSKWKREKEWRSGVRRSRRNFKKLYGRNPGRQKP